MAGYLANQNRNQISGTSLLYTNSNRNHRYVNENLRCEIETFNHFLDTETFEFGSETFFGMLQILCVSKL